MLASVLNSATAAQFHVGVIRSTLLGGFVRA